MNIYSKYSDSKHMNLCGILQPNELIHDDIIVIIMMLMLMMSD